MKTSHATLLEAYRQISKKWLLCGTALVSFLGGSLIANQVTRADQASAKSNRVFELLVYHPTSGKEPALESIFRDVAKLQEKHHLDVIGYWVPDDESGWPNTFVYLVAHPSREKAKLNWAALHADPAFPEYRKAASEILEKVDNKYRVEEVYMRPTDYSAMK
jgi:NIPSNAP protein